MDEALRRPEARRSNILHQLIFDQLDNPLVQNAVVSPWIKKCQEEDFRIDTCGPELDIDPRQIFCDPRADVEIRRRTGSKRFLGAQ